MPTIFLSHTSIDKPFVEKLARDLRKLGIKVWYDKYEIRVGESILWRIEEGISESEYLGIVISKEAWESEWVKTEISAAWQKQIKQKGNYVLPIFYRDCEIPLFLSGIKYADFRTDYLSGLEDLVKVFGIKSLDVITEDNWRKFVRKKGSGWKEFRDKEFEKLITRVCDIAREFNFSVCTGRSKNPYSFVIRGNSSRDKGLSMCIRMDPTQNYRYMETDTLEVNPSNVEKECFKTDIGTTVNEVEEYLSTRIQRFVETYGKPVDKNCILTDKHINIEEVVICFSEIMRKCNWDQSI